ncbi:MAG TPA: hypothetical protein VGG45_12250, partial [Terracidiphilus sp.]
MSRFWDMGYHNPHSRDLRPAQKWVAPSFRALRERVGYHDPIHSISTHHKNGCPVSRVPTDRPSSVGWILALLGRDSTNGRSSSLQAAQIADKVPRKALVFHGGLLYFGKMLKKPEVEQQELELVSIEGLVPAS